jgi:hypothetical protein
LLGVITFLVFLPSLNISFFSDEIAFIERNQADSFIELLSLFDKKEYDADYYRPVGNFVAGAVSAMFNFNPILYRIFNALLHALNSVVVFLLLVRLFRDNNNYNLIAFFSALAFGVFPVHDLAVIWHTDLFDRLMFLFYLSSILFYVKNFKVNTVSLSFFLLALLSKEMAFSLPILIFVTHFILTKDGLLRSIKISLPYAAIAIGFILFRYFVFNNNIFDLADSHTGKGIAAIFKNLVIYSGLLIFPFPTEELQNFFAENQLLFVIAGVVIISLFAYFFSKHKDVKALYLVLFILVTLLPVSRLVMKWYLYLPSVGFTSLLFYLLFTYGKNLRAPLTPIILVIYLGAILLIQFQWVKLTNEGERIILDFKENYHYEIKKANKINLLTIPAEVDGMPIYQLQFDKLLNHQLSSNKNIDILSRSSMESFNERILYKKSEGELRLTHVKDNFFILFGYENYYDISEKDFVNGKLQKLSFNKGRFADGLTFTFSNGKFIRISNEDY